MSKAGFDANLMNNEISPSDCIGNYIQSGTGHPKIMDEYIRNKKGEPICHISELSADIFPPTSVPSLSEEVGHIIRQKIEARRIRMAKRIRLVLGLLLLGSILLSLKLSL